MTRAVNNISSRNANGVICDYLQNHFHLTNCIHLKHHMHKHSLELEERALSRDLILLHRSLSLRDPSTSRCPRWHLPSVNVFLSREYNKNSMIREGRMSADIKQAYECTLFGSLPIFTNFGSSDLVVASKISGRRGAIEGRRIQEEELTRKSGRTDFFDGKEDSLEIHGVDSLFHGVISRNFGFYKENGNNEKGKHHQVAHVKSFSEQPNQVSVESNAISCNTHFHRRHAQLKGRLKSVKRKKLRGDRRIRMSFSSRDVGAESEMSISSVPVVDGFAGSVCCMKDVREDFGDKTIAKVPGNGCGIPWNWSIIHHRSKTFLDMAGRTLSCGMSDSRLKKGSFMSHGEVTPDMPPEESDHSNSISKHDDIEALPLLVGTSQESTVIADWVHDNYGELGIYADHMPRTKIDSEAKSSNWLKCRQKLKGRYQNLIQKYMPRTFKELVGQNLVVQALSNAVMQSKVGLLYLFYEPHGTGKTSCARVFAQALNCQSKEYPKPCGCCNSCIYLDLSKNEDQVEDVLAGLISDDILVDLLDFALSVDTKNAIKNLRIIINTGVEPLSLMLQLAAVITDILVGRHDLSKEKHTRKLFCCSSSPTVQLGFSSSLAKSKAEKLRTHLVQAFESVIGSPVTIELRYQSNNTSARIQMPIFLPSNRCSSYVEEEDPGNDFRCKILGTRKPLNVKREIGVFVPRTKLKDSKLISSRESSRREKQPLCLGEHAVLPMEVSCGTNSGTHKNGKSSQIKIFHTHVINEADSSEEQNRWSIKKAISIAEKLEQENLKLESQSRRLLCWNASNATKWKLSHLKMRTRKPGSLLNCISCRRCISSSSPKQKI